MAALEEFRRCGALAIIEERLLRKSLGLKYVPLPKKEAGFTKRRYD
jgi:hypothetical protein